MIAKLKRFWSRRLVRQANRYLYDLHLKAAHSPDHAIVRCQSAIRMTPDDPEAYLVLGNAYHAKGCSDDAVRQLQNAIQRDVGYYPAHVRLAELLNLQADQAQSEDRTEAAQQLYEGAAAAYRSAFAIQTAGWRERADFGRVLEALGRVDEAIDEYQDALVGDDGNAWLLQRLGSACLDAGRHGLALTTYRRLMETAPGGGSDCDAYREGVACALAGLGDTDAALAEYRQAGAHVEAGELLLALEKPDEALEAFDASIHKDTAAGRGLAAYREMAYYHAGRIYCDQGRHQSARAHLSTFLKLLEEKDPAFFTAVKGRREAYGRYAADARQRLESLPNAAG
jgi:tetratricopeptide (TPR) repeat protein